MKPRATAYHQAAASRKAKTAGRRAALPATRELERQIQELTRTVHLIEEARAHYADQYDFAPYGCLTLDGHGCILELNFTAAKLLGRDRARLVRMPLLPFVEKSCLPTYFQHLRCCKSRREKCVTEIALAVKGCAHRLVELMSVPVDDAHSGQTVYRTALLDVTELRMVQRQVLEISEREQARIGQDLHDGPCQDLTGVAILVEVAAREVNGANPELSARIRDCALRVRESVNEVRRLAAGLFPVKIERYGLSWALRELAAETSQRSAAQCSFHMPVPIVITDQGAALHLYRIAQEAVGNAVRHGRAKEIVLHLAAAGGGFDLTITDDGAGFPSQPEKTGLGLHTMRYRAKMLGGSLAIEPAAPRGTAVICSFPGKEVARVETRHGKEANLPA